MSDSASPLPHRWRDWVGLAARLVLGSVLLVAGLLKIPALEYSVNSVNAYRILPYDLAKIVGYALPFVEILVGLLLVVGLFTRVSAVMSGLLMVAFMIGIASAWARGLSIDCGCFGGGGEIAPDETAYPTEILRDIGLLALAVWLAVRPRTVLAIDGLLRTGLRGEEANPHR